jgi:NADPH:quinone reductase-like Zn-dependent oxidoreductase
VLAQCSASTRDSNIAGTFQHFTVADQLPVCPIPDTISYEAAATLPLALSTAAAGMYPPDHLALDFPSHDPKPSGKTLLVWGGSSSVGCCVIQLAVASGLRVVATCSARNFGLCRRLGASEVFDYKSGTVVEDLIEALGKGACAGIYNGEFCFFRTARFSFTSITNGRTIFLIHQLLSTLTSPSQQSQTRK